MDFIKQLKGFRRQRLANPISANSFALYMVLFELCNDLLFPERFTAPNSILQGYARLSAKALQRARNELIQKGFIEYKNGAGNQCGSYKLIDFCTELNFDSSFCPTVVPANCPTNVPQTVPQMSCNASTLNNLTITGLNSFVNNNNICAQVFAFYKDNMGTDITPLVAEKIADWLTEVDASLVCYAIEQAVGANVRNWNYVNSIIQNHFSAGRKTKAAAEEFAYQRKVAEEPAETWEDAATDIILGGMKDEKMYS